MEEGRSPFNILTVKPTGKRSLGRLKRRWKDNIRMDLKAKCFSTSIFVDSVQDKDYWRVLVNAALNLRFLQVKESVIFFLWM